MSYAKLLFVLLTDCRGHWSVYGSQVWEYRQVKIHDWTEI